MSFETHGVHNQKAHGAVTHGLEHNISRKALGLIKEWAMMHHAELWNNWELSLEQKPLLPIQPLD